MQQVSKHVFYKPQKAFDRVQLKDVFYLFYNTQALYNLVKIIKNVYKSNQI